MITTRVRADGPVEVEVAWLRYLEPERWTSWSPQLRRVEYEFGRLRPGTGGRVFGPLGLWLNFWIEDVDEDARTWTWVVRRGPFSVVLQHGVEPGPRGSRTWLALRGPAPLVLPYLPMARLALHRLVSAP
ncbi:hypothetical protein [Kineosporia sp. NBRC 101731]|uniref:SRPBCC family protein n=1 Tax=Kineosporia sp. NBRC 101731 TaxID=3032199 RepID=UPI0024A282CC|nr:hypothetical protein [Kineosporia sp. NBRC 101731]GLY31291.1 hypothetical protein Kisp02_46560 [Kineosporia sp. NBRC 101731]